MAEALGELLRRLRLDADLTLEAFSGRTDEADELRTELDELPG